MAALIFLVVLPLGTILAVLQEHRNKNDPATAVSHRACRPGLEIFDRRRECGRRAGLIRTVMLSFSVAVGYPKRSKYLTMQGRTKAAGDTEQHICFQV